VRYLIDGYNLLHAMGLVSGKAGPHGLERARLALLGRLCGDHGEASGAVTVVFDASGARPGAVPEAEYKGIHLRYALDSTADDVIETLIRHDPTPQQLTVVSDDHRLQQAAQRRRCRALGCMEYLDEMEARRGEKPDREEVAAKPESLSDDEKQHWMREFAELADDPEVRDGLGPDFAEDEPK
jgi:predicted RNA-binding protein with PIN domain